MTWSEDTFEAGGAELWAELAPRATDAAVEALITEACRVKDRLDGLNRVLTRSGRFWATLEFGNDDVIEVRIDSALAESRQQATVFRHLLAEIRRQVGDNTGEGDDDLDGLG